ncbi:C6 transcription factor [Purpureocillium lavendulum]|uniref:C6 transcription factor n=1 Tax=Purpureocillium lavendulum TaxID=1247861 RepID=A0AB34G6Q9_9HYPO|nr:C6 transcription factor [Purpureocillium lavendulum]
MRQTLARAEKKYGVAHYYYTHVASAQDTQAVGTAPRLTYNEAQRRTQWLEGEFLRKFGVDCTNVPTGVQLQGMQSTSNDPAGGISQLQSPRARRASVQGSSNGPGHATGSDAASPDRNESVPEISLLALNATGELRYLGPSSGAVFANYAMALVRSIAASSTKRRRHGPARAATETPLMSGDNEQQHCLSPHETRLLLQSYNMWVHPLYPLLDPEFLDDLVSRCSAFPSSRDAPPAQGQELGIFYLVMALGSLNHTNTVKQLQLGPSTAVLSERAASPAHLYSEASRHFVDSVEHMQLRPSISFIQIMLLVCIYSFSGPIGSSQWQLAGLAMRTAVEIGLHCSLRGWQASSKDIDDRNRVFWTAYAIEISLAYNLGRPPSIGQEHITAKLPDITSRDTALGVHHIRHRQIQARIVSQVYYGNDQGNGDLREMQQSRIASLQSELDEWRLALDDICPRDSDAQYPRSHQFEFLADDTLAFVSKELTTHVPADSGYSFRRQDGIDSSLVVGQSLPEAAPALDQNAITGWENLDLFNDFLGIDDSQTFWGPFAPELDSFDYNSRMLLG